MYNYIFTDGACIKNGKPNVKASFAAIVGDVVVKGFVSNKELKIENDVIIETDKIINPSNNRAELYGIIFGFIYMLNLLDKNRNIIELSVEIVKDGDIPPLDDLYDFNILYSDSLITVNTINKWYNNREKNNTLSEFKNLDLLNIMMYLYRKIDNIKSMHVRSHKKNTNSIYIMNNLVDKYASSLLG